MNKSHLNILGQNIQQYRKLKNLSQHELGHLVGISGDIIGRYERGSVNPTFTTIIKIAKSLDITLDELVGNKDNPLRKDISLRLKQLETLPNDALENILNVMEAFIRDYRVKETIHKS